MQLFSFLYCYYRLSLLNFRISSSNLQYLKLLIGTDFFFILTGITSNRKNILRFMQKKKLFAIIFIVSKDTECSCSCLLFSIKLQTIIEANFYQIILLFRYLRHHNHAKRFSMRSYIFKKKKQTICQR